MAAGRVAIAKKKAQTNSEKILKSAENTQDPLSKDEKDPLTFNFERVAVQLRFSPAEIYLARACANLAR